MNPSFFDAVRQQFVSIWTNFKFIQKTIVVLVGVTLVGLLVFLVFYSSGNRYEVLFSPEKMVQIDINEVKSYLDEAGIPYKVSGQTILVPSQSAPSIRLEFSSLGVPKMTKSKGFELFDSSTWIKGEKELQILEMRALKGQLEQDISHYENVRSASVILDIAPQKSFGGSPYRTKASVILNLIPGTRLANSELRAITFHLSGAVRGLSPNMVAISDTTGRLYQAIDPDGDYDTGRAEEVTLEEQIKTKIDGMLSMVVGHDNFYSTVQVVISKSRRTQERKVFSGTVDGVNLGSPVIINETRSMQDQTNASSLQKTPLNKSEDDEKFRQTKQLAVPQDITRISSSGSSIDGISIGVLINKAIINDPLSTTAKRNGDELKKEIQNQLTTILEGYNVKAKTAVDFVEFDRAKLTPRIIEQTSPSSFDTLHTLAIICSILALLCILLIFIRFGPKKRPQVGFANQLKKTDSRFKDITEDDLGAMIDSLKNHCRGDPKLVAETIQDWLKKDEF